MAINKCRVCLVETFSKLLCWTAPLGTANHESITYLECFEVCTRLGANEHDQLPQTLCFQCAAELRVAYEFIKKAKQSHEMLLMKQEEFVKIKENGEPAPIQNEFIGMKEHQELAAPQEVFIKMEENGEEATVQEEEFISIEENEPEEAKTKFIEIATKEEEPSVAPELQKVHNYVNSNTKKKHSRPVSKKQKQLLLNQMKANRALGCGVPKAENSKELWETHKKIWRKIASELNSTKEAIKTGPQWKQVWNAWKCAVKRHYISIKRFEAQIQAGLEVPASVKPKKLNELDEQVVQFLDVYKGNEHT